MHDPQTAHPDDARPMCGPHTAHPDDAQPVRDPHTAHPDDEQPVRDPHTGPLAHRQSGSSASRCADLGLVVCGVCMCVCVLLQVPGLRQCQELSLAGLCSLCMHVRLSLMRLPCASGKCQARCTACTVSCCAGCALWVIALCGLRVLLAVPDAGAGMHLDLT